MKYSGSGFEDLHPTNAELVLAFDCEIEEQHVEAIKKHVAQCTFCCAQWDELRATSELMAEHHASFLQSQVPVSNEDTHAFAAQLGRGRVIPPVTSSQMGHPVQWPALMQSWQKLAIAGAVAAVILISVGIWSRIPNKSAPAVQPPPAQVASVVAPKEAVATAKTQAPRSRGRHIGAWHVGGKQPATSQPATSTTAMKKEMYYELPFSDASLPLEQATIVRVKLPAQSLRVAGVPVEEENANTMLQADLLLGIDGLPRGIRLVRNGNGTN